MSCLFMFIGKTTLVFVCTCSFIVTYLYVINGCPHPLWIYQWGQSSGIIYLLVSIGVYFSWKVVRILLLSSPVILEICVWVGSTPLGLPSLLVYLALSCDHCDNPLEWPMVTIIQRQFLHQNIASKHGLPELYINKQLKLIFFVT